MICSSRTGPLRLAPCGGFIPRDLPLDTFEGRCWVGIAPFHMSHIHGARLAAVAGTLAIFRN